MLLTVENLGTTIPQDGRLEWSLTSIYRPFPQPQNRVIRISKGYRGESKRETRGENAAEKISGKREGPR
jgi:hypothetical protein